MTAASADRSPQRPIPLVSALQRAHETAALPALPSGTVTFLFTDLEGGTWLRAALDRHDAILAEAITQNGGSVFKTVGDATCAAFSTAADAIAAALAAQRTLLAEPWGVTGELRARMALHSGSAVEYNGDYAGAPLNRVTRLLSVGHGGQILLSAATHELVLDALPTETWLRDLGQHRLKDLDRPEHIYQLLAPDLPIDFPPLRTLDTHPTNMSVPPTSLIGREQEVQAVAELVRRPDVRLVTLTGPGGIGKTRLALQVATDLISVFPDGVYVVSLASVRDPNQVIPAIAQVLGLQDAGERPLQERLRAYLSPKKLLFVLDNFEQVVTAAPLVTDLLAACPHLTVLATSRIPLHVAGEHEVSVPPLTVPDPLHPPSPQQLLQAEAVRLFVERAQGVKSDFVLTDANAPAVAQICRHLDGLPLAIELAAARCKVFSPPALLPRLSDRFQLLSGGPRDVPERLRTMRAAVGWSHDMLSHNEQVFFRRLAVFVGGCRLEAAEAVSNAAGEIEHDSEALEALISLVEHSLVWAAEGPDGEPRFAMLETIREYAHERLAASGEDSATRDAHAAHFLDFAERAELAVILPGGDRWLSRVTAEQENLRAALAWLEATGERELFLRLAGALSFFWFVRGHYREGSEWLERALAGETAVPAGMRAKALRGLGFLTPLRNDDRRTRLFSESATLCHSLGDQQGECFALIGLGAAARYQHDHDRAEHLLTEALSLARGLADSQEAATLASVAMSELGYVALEQDNRALAAAYFEKALGEGHASGGTWQATFSLLGLGLVALGDGDSPRALNRFQDALAAAWSYGEQRVLLRALAGVAAVVAASGQSEQAARLFGALEALSAAIGMPDAAVFRSFHAAAQRGVAAVRAALDSDTLAAAWGAGRALPLEQALVEAAEVTLMSSLPPRSTGPAASYRLTARELEVLRLLVEHQTDREIAEALFLSRRTVGWHVTHILNKLGVDSRREAAVFAHREGLV